MPISRSNPANSHNRKDPRDIKIRNHGTKNADLTAINIELKTIIAELTEKVAKLMKNSSNSSKPTLSDIVSVSHLRDKRRKRKQGTQKGYKRKLRTVFDPEQIDEVKQTTLDECPSCSGVLISADKPAKVHQQNELV